MSLARTIIGTAFAQDPEFIPCPDGTMADPSVGCIKAPQAIVNPNSEILTVLLKTADAVVMIAVAAAVGFMIYGGILYAVSLGNEDRIKKAKSILFWSIFGLMLAVTAKTIVATVLAIITQ